MRNAASYGRGEIPRSNLIDEVEHEPYGLCSYVLYTGSRRVLVDERLELVQ